MCVFRLTGRSVCCSVLFLSLALFVFFLILVSRPHRIIKTNNTLNAANIHINHWQFVGSQNDVDTIQFQLKIVLNATRFKAALARSLASSTNGSSSCTQSNQENLFAIYLHFSIPTWESNTYKYFNCRRRRRGRCRRGTHSKFIEVLSRSALLLLTTH